MTNNFKKTIEFDGLDYKKEVLKICLINAIGALTILVSYFFIQEIVMPMILFMAIGVLDYFLVSSYSEKKRKILKAREDEFVSILSYFEVYITNNKNVYQSFKLLLPYCSDWMKTQIENMLQQIDNDKSVQPFVNFASKFTSSIAHSVMLSIFQMIDQGENSLQLTQFSILFEQIGKTRSIELSSNKEKSMSNVSTFPLAGAGLITIILTISILSILEDLINVL